MSRSEIIPRLFVGSKPAPGRHAGIDVIVLAAKEYQPPSELFPGIEVLRAPLDDAPPSLAEVATAMVMARRVARRLAAGRRVLVTCAMGLNRSALIAGLAMLELFPSKNADAVIRQIRAARGPWALSNPSFEQLLRIAARVRRAASESTDQPV